MVINVYEYLIRDRVSGTVYTGSYSLKADCPKADELAKKFKAKLVDTFEITPRPAPKDL